MKSDAYISVIIPVYNRAGLVGRTLESIAAQTCRRFDVILVDNGSTDNTREILDRWASAQSPDHIRVTILSERRPGACHARNLGFSVAETPLVMFFDSDDIMSPRLIDAITDCFESNPESDIVGWDIAQQLPSGKFHKGRFETVAPLYNHIIHGSLSTQRFACRRQLIERAGGWDGSVRGWNDYELGMRLLLLRPVISKLDLSDTVTTFFTETSITGRSFSDDPEKWEHSLSLCRDNLLRAGHDDAAVWIDVRRMILAARYAGEGAADHSRRLRRETLGQHHGIKRAALRLIYLKARIYPRGTHLVARLFFPVPK